MFTIVPYIPMLDVYFIAIEIDDGECSMVLCAVWRTDVSYYWNYHESQEYNDYNLRRDIKK